MSVDRYSKIDLHDWSINKEQFQALIVKYNYKVDETKVNMDALLRNALANTRNNAEFTIQFAKMEKLPRAMVEEVIVREKEIVDRLLNIGILEALRINIIQEAIQLYQKEEEYKKAIFEFLTYLKAKSEEKNHLNEILFEQQMEIHNKEEMERIMKEYTAWLNQKEADSLNQFNLLGGERKELEALKAQQLQLHAKLVVADLEEIRDKNGKSIFDGKTQAEKEQITAEILLASHETKRWIEKQMQKELDIIKELEARKLEIEQQIAALQGGTPFESNSSRKTISPLLNSKSANGTAKLYAELEKINGEIAKREADLPNKEIEYTRQATERFKVRVADILSKHNITHDEKVLDKVVHHHHHNDIFNAAHSVLNSIHKQLKAINKEEKKIAAQRKENAGDAKAVKGAVDDTIVRLQENKTEKEEKAAREQEAMISEEEVTLENEELSAEFDEYEAMLKMLAEASEEIDPDSFEQGNQQNSLGDEEDEIDASLKEEKDSKHIRVPRM